MPGLTSFQSMYTTSFFPTAAVPRSVATSTGSMFLIIWLIGLTGGKSINRPLARLVSTTLTRAAGSQLYNLDLAPCRHTVGISRSHFQDRLSHNFCSPIAAVATVLNCRKPMKGNEVQTRPPKQTPKECSLIKLSTADED